MKSKKAAAIMLCAVLGTSMITGVSVSAKDKDELVLYTWDGMFPQEVLDDFEKETGTKVVYSNFDTDETMLEKLSQAKGGDYEVISRTKSLKRDMEKEQEKQGADFNKEEFISQAMDNAGK